ncbi:peptidase inhibitor family I36 protein [Streptomyces sp. NPDC007264]|uniref:peptidase inhibitor family I36 protein n=1 Tax=Streptomyces sp. NPDC007264 TaxID=3364777 RepID=UPI0036DBCBA8
MNARRRIGIGIATLALLGGTTSGIAAAADQGAVGTRATNWHGCPAGYLCVWPKKNFKGHMQKVKANNRNLAQYGGAFRNGVRSGVNHGRSCDAALYRKTNYRSYIGIAKRGAIDGNVAGYPVQSNKWVNCR